MNTKTFAAELRELIVQLKNEQGINEIKSDNLIAYLDEVIGGEEKNQEKYKAELQLWVERNKLQQSFKLEEFKAVIQQGQNALKAAFLMNGGAVIAILAFLGKLAGINQVAMSALSDAMLIFVSGVFLAGLASGCTYLAQYVAAFRDQYKWAFILGFALNILVIVMGLSSYGFFIWGAVYAKSAFTAIT